MKIIYSKLRLNFLKDDLFHTLLTDLARDIRQKEQRNGRRQIFHEKIL